MRRTKGYWQPEKSHAYQTLTPLFFLLPVFFALLYSSHNYTTYVGPTGDLFFTDRLAYFELWKKYSFLPFPHQQAAVAFVIVFCLVWVVGLCNNAAADAFEKTYIRRGRARRTQF